ncbi:serpin family protein [Flammeovirga pacifica]|uniref:Serpin domain-containing protein n=1 Tax=Flammeovirga pacifica TaxID=915059 RepID=A0A1S1YW25_FLAPC|nr:serpin family protein [Flammeovirga pacifica]OHX65228.1 hypothetical protein NH26_02095 [Flammeovirga pacifica]
MSKFFLLTVLCITIHLSKANAQSDFELLKSIHTEDKSYVISNYSIHSALGMLSLCTEGDAQQEILRFFDVDSEGALVKNHQKITSILNSFNNEFSINNGLWMDKPYHLQSNVKKELINYYQLYFKSISFKNSELVKSTINNYVNDKTEGKIKEVVSKVEKDDKMLLINTVLMRAAWKDQFQEKNTKEGEFFLEDGTTININYLSDLNRKAFCFKNDTINVLKLPFENDKMELMLISSNVFSMNELLSSSINKNTISALEAKMKEKEVFFKMPKVKITYTKDIIPELKGVGLNHIFFPGQAGFTKMVKQGGENLYVSKVMHESIIEFNEWGTEAAAVTSVSISRSALQPEKEEYYFNQPFIFLIKEKATDSYLFMGVYQGK